MYRLIYLYTIYLLLVGI